MSSLPLESNDKPELQSSQSQVPQPPTIEERMASLAQQGLTSSSIGTQQGIIRGPRQSDPPSAAHGAKSYDTPPRTLVGQGKSFNPTSAFNGLQTLYPNGGWKTSNQLKILREKGYDVKEEVNKLNKDKMILRLIPPRSGGSKTRKKLKLKLMPAKKIERKYKQSLKNKVKLNHSQVNRSKLPNEVANNKTKKHLRLKLIKKKKPVKKYKKSFKK